MTAPILDLPPGSIDAGRTAVFLDFDGTLVEIAERPDRVQLAPATRGALSRLFTALGGALAVVTGRDIADIDSFLDPLHLPVAGVHGLTRRGHDGTLSGRQVDGRAIVLLDERLRALVARAEGVMVERKSASIALHYRARPDLEADCIAAMDEAAHGIEAIHLIRGKMVIEAKADAGNKGGAVADFMSEAPFSGRVPLFAGDDVTDEDAFAVVNAAGGISVKVGQGATAARYRADSTPQFLGWLQSVADDLERA